MSVMKFMDDSLTLPPNSSLDVEDVKFVINYDFPSNVEDYVHRIGRTGRSNNKGTSYTFFTSNNAAKVDELMAILKETNQYINPELYDLKRYSGNNKRSYGKSQQYGTFKRGSNFGNSGGGGYGAGQGYGRGGGNSNSGSGYGRNNQGYGNGYGRTNTETSSNTFNNAANANNGTCRYDLRKPHDDHLLHPAHPAHNTRFGNTNSTGTTNEHSTRKHTRFDAVNGTDRKPSRFS